MCFGPNSRAVQSWEVCELEYDFIDCGPLLFSYGEFFKVTCAAVQEQSGMYIDSHLERCVLVQTAELYSAGK